MANPRRGVAKSPRGIDRRGHARRFRYSVVAPVYNEEKYLDEFFASIVSQSLDFKTNIELIAVDDGSTDRSGKIARRWARKYPHNIRYVHKPNGGLSSARNLGLTFATGDWITFIDGDDYVDRDYFHHVHGAVEKYSSLLAMISCNYIIYEERTHTRRDTHPLRYRFASGERIVATDDLGRNIQVTVNSAFMRRDIISERGLQFDSRIKPGFEDAHFVGRYLMSAPGTSIAFLPAAEYFHRRRADQSSLTDTALSRPEQYCDELKFGYLGLLTDALSRHGSVPDFVQNIVMFCLSFAFTHALERPEQLSFLNDSQLQEYRDLLAETFSHIDANTLIEYNLYHFPLFYRFGILARLKNEGLPYQLAEITDFDADRNLVRLVFWTSDGVPKISFCVGAEQIEPAYAKRRRLDFLGAPFAFEHICWLPAGTGGQPLTLAAENREVRIDLKGRRIVGTVPLSQVRQAFAVADRVPALLSPAVRAIRTAGRSPKAVAKYARAWIFMDRDTEGDDSAEHLYRYIREHRPDINAFFVLRRGTPDWERLAGEGDRLLGYGEPPYVLALLNAAYVLSSHLDQYVWRYLDPASFGDMTRFKFVFLQHGVTQGDYSRLLNFVPIDCLMTSTFGEFESIVGDKTPYKFTRKEVFLTGLPRHDILLSGPIEDGRTIVIMPTWRLSLTGPHVSVGNARSVNPQFYESEFARRWMRVLHSRRLKAAAELGGHRVVFVAHPNNEPYIDFFNPPPSIEVRTFSSGESLKSIFQQLSVFITDYSSKAFDAAYTGKPVIYYQFDRELTFGGGHLSVPGYFSYERDGFGPVYREEAELLDAIERITGGVAPDPVYRDRAAKTFAFRDGKSRERVLQAVLSLDASDATEPLSPKYGERLLEGGDAGSALFER